MDVESTIFGESQTPDSLPLIHDSRVKSSHPILQNSKHYKLLQICFYCLQNADLDFTNPHVYVPALGLHEKNLALLKLCAHTKAYHYMLETS